MLLAAALVPPTALLVPGAAGRQAVLEDERAAVHEAVRGLLAVGPDRVVVLVPGDLVVDERPAGALRVTLAAAGVPDARTDLGSTGAPGGVTGADDTLVEDVPAAVGVWLLRHAGWEGPTAVVGAAQPERAATALAADGAVAVLALGTSSARHGEQAALAPEPDGDALDDAVLRWVAGGAEPDGERLARHAVTLAGPLRVLDVVAEGELISTGVRASAPLGVTYVVATWTRRHLAARDGA